MSDAIEARLKELGVTLPAAAAPAANYVPYVLTGNLLFISGQGPMVDGKVVVGGHLGRDVDVPTGQKAAELTAINLLAQAKAALGSLDRIKRIVKLTGFVASTPDFTEQHLVINGASDFLAKVLGDAGKHSRAAVGTAALPLGFAVEIEAIMEVSE